jgi:hypothetical protein
VRRLSYIVGDDANNRYSPTSAKASFGKRGRLPSTRRQLHNPNPHLKTMLQYPNHNYAQFVALAEGSGSGLGKKWYLDGSLEALGALLRRDSTAMEIREAIAKLGRARDKAHSSKLRKYGAKRGESVGSAVDL